MPPSLPTYLPTCLPSMNLVLQLSTMNSIVWLQLAAVAAPNAICLFYYHLSHLLTFNNQILRKDTWQFGFQPRIKSQGISSNGPDGKIHA